MYDCDCLIHPFQNDPGASQSQRVMDDLLSGAVKIDARTLADLLDFFVQMSRHINFYDKNLNVSDWQPFFQKSIPFVLASVIRTPFDEVEQNFNYYNSLFQKKPSATGLQLHAWFIYYRFINKINSWYASVKDTGLPVETFLLSLMKDKLSDPLKKFISYSNAAVKYYGIKKIDFSSLDASAWNLDATDLYAIDTSFQTGTLSKYQQIENLFEKFKLIYQPFATGMQAIIPEAENNLEPSLLPLKEELQKKQPPHLALLFAFLNIFRQPQGDLNGFTRKHLDFFYKEVLQLKAQGAIADKAHIVFEIQKQLKKYLLKKGLAVKDGKDINKQEILFSLDDEIVVNQTQVADTKTLFLNNLIAHQQTYVEGVYMATDATKADGIDKDFPDGQPVNFSTLGARLSKYADPESKTIKPYPNARLGFILASPVLYLKEGDRNINITLACQLNDSICTDIGNTIIQNAQDCCNPNTSGTGTKAQANPYPDFLSSSSLEIFEKVQDAISKQYIYLSEDVFKIALTKGLDADFISQARNQFMPDTPLYKPCYCDVPVYKTEVSVPLSNWNSFVSSFADKKLLIDEIFIPENILNVLFSGEKDWIKPSALNISLGNFSGNNFLLNISATIDASQPSVTFYSKQTLKEDFGSAQPLVKVELNDRLKLAFGIPQSTQNQNRECCEQSEKCCLLLNDIQSLQTISFYHFFRNVNIEKDSKIDVQVCGLKNLIVQNDETIDDVNKLMHPFGTRPKVGSNFYVGNKEIFMKSWNELWINIEWKDRPLDFKDYYKHYTYEPFEDGSTEIKNDSFKIKTSLLVNGNWKLDGTSNLFTDPKLNRAPYCKKEIPPQWFEDVYDIKTGDFNYAPDGTIYVPPPFNTESLTPYGITSDYGFLRFTLEGVSFQHDRYAFVLMRHILALNNLVDPISIKFAQDFTKDAQKLIAAIILRVQSLQTPISNIQTNSSNINDEIANFFTGLQTLMSSLSIHLGNAQGAANLATAIAEVNSAIAITPQINSHISNIVTDNNAITTDIDSINHLVNDDPGGPLDYNNLNGVGLKRLADDLKNVIDQIADKLKVNTDLKTGLPKEPYTPTLKSIFIDYTASATIEDIDLIHLYPYPGTYKAEQLQTQPALFPTFCDEGTLFIGLSNLVPGNNLNLLFQLAEATSDSESARQNVQWSYLDTNVWKPLRTGFEVLDDATENLTTSGIVKFALPANMTNTNTVMPTGMHWIKASVTQNSKAVSETIGILAQAIRVTFTNDAANDKLRLSQPLAAGSISKLSVADANVKSVKQPYDSFGGLVPEIEQQYYVRVSELLRHKGRAIQKFDYERLALQQFPQLFKVKCINHSFALDANLYKNDFPYSPGYVILAVIPDLNKLKAGNSFQPKAPVSILEEIETFLKARTSPFVRFRAMNPRYEKINFCIRVSLLPGKDENYYKEKLKQDISEFLAPWAVGQYDKLTFGQCIYRSDIIRFMENTDYVDFVTDFRFSKQTNTPDSNSEKICPDTPRSILIAGDIEICINSPECEDWLMYDNQGKKIPGCDKPVIPVENYCGDLVQLK